MTAFKFTGLKACLLPCATSMLLTGCLSTAASDVAEQQHAPLGQQTVEQTAPACPEHSPEQTLGGECQLAQEGVFAVTHPVDEPEIAQQDLPEPVNDDLPIGYTNIWDRVRDELSFDVPDNKRINAQRRWYLKHPAYMERVVKRAKPYLYYITETLEAHDMPSELVLLPIVESAFDPFAYSHGRAAGMWQFIPGTGKRFGMKQTWWYDGRRDVVASTEGAIKYLNYLLKMFDGNWLHALAAYNSGEGRVAKAIRKNKRAGKPTDFWSLDLPKETRAYVPKLLALADILANHDQYDFAWTPVDNAPVLAIVETGSQIDLALAADMAGISLETLHALNPGFNRWATDPNGPHRLVVPIDKGGMFEQALAETDDSKWLNWVRHKVKSGDSLLKLAKHYHTTVDIIRKVNEMRGNMIRVGDHLLVPVALKSLDSYSLSEDQRLAATQSRPRKGHQLTHTVKSGDTFWDLSREYKVNLRSLAKWNGMAPTDTLRPGQKLVIWVKQVSESQRDNAIMRSLTYTVRRGDSLARIAGRFKVSVKDIQKWNQIDPKRYLQPGQKLKLYVDVTRT